MVSVLGHLPTKVKITVLRLGSDRGMGALLAPRASTESAPLSSLSFGASSDGPPGEVGPHSPGKTPTAAAFCEEWTLIQQGYICSSPYPLISWSHRVLCQWCLYRAKLSIFNIPVQWQRNPVVEFCLPHPQAGCPSIHPVCPASLQVMYLPTCHLSSCYISGQRPGVSRHQQIDLLLPNTVVPLHMLRSSGGASS